MEIILQLLVNALIAAGVYALVASGLSFIYATTRVFHLAHGAVIAFSAYVFWWLGVRHEWSMLLAAIVGVLAGALLGVLMNELVYEPLRRRKTKGMGYLLATIALLMIGNSAILALFGGQTRSFSLQTRIYDILGTRVSFLQLFIIALSAVLLASFALFMKRSRFGKAMRACADNETVAEVLGINTRTIRRMTFLVGSLLGGVAGIFIALEFNLDPNMGLMIAIRGFTAMIIGGAGSMGGAIAGALFLGGVEQAAVWYWGSGWKSAMSFMLLFVFLLIRPRGVFGRKAFH